MRRTGSSNPITVRNLPPAVAKVVRDKAKKERLSLNKAVVRLLEEVVAPPAAKAVVHHDLDRFFGGWAKKEADAFDKVLRQQRAIDAEMWE
jgi:hypothetical protein